MPPSLAAARPRSTTRTHSLPTLTRTPHQRFNTQYSPCSFNSKHIYLNRLECRGNYSATSNNTKLAHWPGVPPRPLLDVPNVTAHPSTASVPAVPIIVLQYNSPLLCGCNVGIKGLSGPHNLNETDIQLNLKQKLA